MVKESSQQVVKAGEDRMSDHPQQVTVRSAGSRARVMGALQVLWQVSRSMCLAIKILEENLGSKILDISRSNVFSVMPPQARETKEKK